MYWVLGTCIVCCTLLIVPRMDIQSPGKAVLAKRGGTVIAVSATEITVDDTVYPFKAQSLQDERQLGQPQGILVWPAMSAYQEPIVEAGQQVKKKEPLARGVTHIYFQANVWVFTSLLFVVGIMMGIGKAAVHKHIPDYFPKEIGVAGGIVGFWAAWGDSSARSYSATCSKGQASGPRAGCSLPHCPRSACGGCTRWYGGCTTTRHPRSGSIWNTLSIQPRTPFRTREKPSCPR